MNILYQCNEKYAPYCGISITSLFENNKDSNAIAVYILDDGISEESKIRFDSLSKKYNQTIIFISTDKLIEKMKELGVPPYRGSYTANFKMFINEFIPNSVNRLLYIDSDTIVDGNLKELFDMDLNNCSIAMSLDSLVNNYKIQIGLKDSDKYYNSGVILFDVNKWKTEKCSEKIIEHTKNVRAHYSAPDQDLININFKGNIFTLSPKYNMEPAYFMFNINSYYKTFHNDAFYNKEEIVNAKNDVRIYHFFRVMGEFPWHKNNMHPFNDVFNKYLAISPWSDYKKQGSGISSIFKIEKSLYRFLPQAVFIRLFKLSHEMFMNKSNKMSLKNENNKLM